MIDRVSDSAVISGAEASSDKVFRAVYNERTAGSIPSWDSRKSSPKTAMSFGEVLEAESVEVGLPDGNKSEDESFGFFDLLDMINPLQHLPIIGTIYRAITGDEIKPISRIIGGGIFGGPMGAASGLVTAVVEDGTGKEPVNLALSFISGEEDFGQDQQAAKAVAHYERSKQTGLRIARTVEYNA